MSSPQILGDENKILRNNITQEYFKEDNYMAIRFKIVLKEMQDYSQNCSYIIRNLENVYSSLSKNHV